MTRFIHDEFSKDYLEELLKPFGQVKAPSRVAAEVKEIDVLFSPIPTQTGDLARLGILGMMAKTAAIFEPFRNLASVEEIKVTLELLYNLQQNLRINQNTEAEDRELVMRLAPLYQQDREQTRQEGLQQGLQEGLQQGEQQLIPRQLNRRLGTINLSLVEQVQRLSTQQLEALGEELLDFSTVSDLEVWLETSK